MTDEKITEIEILHIHNFPVLLNSQNFHLFCKWKGKPEGCLKIDCATDTLMGCECDAVKSRLQIMLFPRQFYFRDLYMFFFSCANM